MVRKPKVSRSTFAFLFVVAVIVPACTRDGRVAQPAQAETNQRRVEPVLVNRPMGGFDGTIRLAAIFPTIGRYALSGVQSQNGARLAVEDVNRRGGIHGRRLTLLEYRTGSYFVDARHAADLASGEGAALAIIGSNASSLSMAIAELAESRGIVQVSNVSTAQDLTWDPVTGKDRRFVFRVCGSDAEMGAALAAFASRHLRAHRAAVLYEVGRTYSAKLAKGFIEGFRDRAAGRVTAEFVYIPLETDFRSQLRNVADFHADVLFIPGSFTDATLIATQAESLGIRPTLLGGDAWSNRLLFKRGGPSRAAFYSDHCAPPEAFRERYRNAFGGDADGCRAVLGYDAVQAVVEALRLLGPLSDEDLGPRLTLARERLRQAISGVAFTGQTGPIRFDAHGDNRRGVAVMEVQREPAVGYVSRLHVWLNEG